MILASTSHPSIDRQTEPYSLSLPPPRRRARPRVRKRGQDSYFHFLLHFPSFLLSLGSCAPFFLPSRAPALLLAGFLTLLTRRRPVASPPSKTISPSLARSTMFLPSFHPFSIPSRLPRRNRSRPRPRLRWRRCRRWRQTERVKREREPRCHFPPVPQQSSAV